MTVISLSGEIESLSGELEHALELFSCQPEKERHLFELVAPLVICRAGAESLDAGFERAASHLLRHRAAGSTAAILCLMDTKFT